MAMADDDRAIAEAELGRRLLAPQRPSVATCLPLHDAPIVAVCCFRVLPKVGMQSIRGLLLRLLRVTVETGEKLQAI